MHAQVCGDTKLREVVGTLESRTAFQRELDGWRKGLTEMSWKLSEGKCQVLHKRWKNSIQQNRLVAEELESIFAEENVGALVGKQWNIIQQCALAGMKPSQLPSFVNTL